MRFFEKAHQQHLMISGGDVLTPKGAKAPMINLQLAGEGGRISGTGSLIPVGEPISNFTVTGTTHTFGRQIIISLRAYEWEQFIGTIQIGLNIMTNDGAANYNIRSGKTWKVGEAAVKGEALPSLIQEETEPVESEFFQLTTLFMQDKGVVLEGNGGFSDKNTLDGAAFLSGQTNASGTMWKKIPLDNGFFQLTTLFMQDKGVVLEGNGGLSDKNTLGGAAFLSGQTNASGTMWKEIPLKNGFFQLTTLFMQDKGVVLEGNGGLSDKNTLDGAAFLSGQTNASGTMWKMIPVK